MKLPKVYEPAQYEPDIYVLWEKSGAFTPDFKKSRHAYTIIMPPPNANASLHAGHSLTYVLQDIAARYHRLKGEASLWLPGADHAGFETQVVYEKHLAKAGKSRFDFSREELYQQIWDFVQANKSGFEEQLRKLGASCDWSRFTFTLDDKVIKTAYTTFEQMWKEKLVYRGERIVNFCTFHGTGFADIEVEYKPVKGKLWHIRYPLTDGSGEVVVATTRPETMLGDTAVAIHPDDDRYKPYLGKTVKLPLTEREIPVIADKMVEREFGSGAVKITPAHDPNDFEVARRHDLPFMTIIDHEGKMSHEVPPDYRGLAADKARDAVVKDLDRRGFLVKEEAYGHSVGHCYKCGTVIQPLLRDQWFVDMKPLAARAVKALRADKIKFYPASKRDEVIRYLEGVKDWNISRQIAWGIPIPAFQNIDAPEEWIFDDRTNQEIIEVGNKTYRRDPDVFDTWFSSGQWPFVTLDFPDGEDFKHFYPTDLMETGVDILFQWVARMICLGLYVTGDIPFKEVYLHGMVRSEDGRKMSKSLGNVIPLEETIGEYGADALRLGIVAGRSPGYSAAYAPMKVIGGRNFCNKLWNVARYVEDKLGEDAKLAGKPAAQNSPDHWMLSKLQQSTEKVRLDLDSYRFSEAYETVYHLLWDDFADWYIEASKTQLNPGVLSFGLQTILKLAHPFAPFVTETIWQALGWEKDSLLMTARWPSVPAAASKQAEEFEQLRDIVTEIRYIRSALKMSGLTLYHRSEQFLEANAELIKRLAGLTAVTSVSDGEGLHLTQTTSDCWLDVSHEAAEHYAAQLADKKAEQEKVIAQLKSRLDNPHYVKNAPRHVVGQTKEQLAEAEAQLAKITAEHDRFATS